jgi:Skp family chaperone for outer membrane proteins
LPNSFLLTKIKTDYFFYKGEMEMARKANYDEKISAIEAKIAKKQDELKALKAQLNEIKAKKAQDDYKELTEYMAANNLSASEVLASIKG